MKPLQTFHFPCGRFVLTLGERTLVMGILNITPDSFSDGGCYFDKSAAIAHGQALAASGADIIDIGGESSRPYADAITADEEIRRVVPVIEALADHVSVPISIDTYKASVAEEAIRAGASIVNDISALQLDPRLASVVAEYSVSIILMHMRGTPQTMQDKPIYNDVVMEVKGFLKDAINHAVECGIDYSKIIVDPGIGFGKTVKHNLQLLKFLSEFHELGAPVLVGPSRKSFLTKLLGSGPDQRELGTQAAAAMAAINGAHIVRAHNVERTKATLKIVDAIRNPNMASVT